jgi:hypothetical protein
MNSEFMRACTERNIPFVRNYISHNVLTIKDFNDGLWWSCMYHNVELAKIMIEHGANDFHDCIYITRSNVELVKLLIDSNANGDGYLVDNHVMVKIFNSGINDKIINFFGDRGYKLIKKRNTRCEEIDKILRDYIISDVIENILLPYIGYD